MQFSRASVWVLYSSCPESVKPSFTDFSWSSSAAADEIRFTPSGSHAFWLCLRTENRALGCFEVPEGGTLSSVKLTFFRLSPPPLSNIFFFFLSVSFGPLLQIVVWSVEEWVKTEEGRASVYKKKRLLHDVLGERGGRNRFVVFLILSRCQRDRKGRSHGAEEDTGHQDHGREEQAGECHDFC